MERKYNLSLSELMDFFCSEEHQGFLLEEVEAAEKRLGVSFPCGYRKFLLTYGRDEVTIHSNKLIEPKEIYISYEEETSSSGEEYVIIWHGKANIWSAGYLKADLLDGIPDPPIFLSFCTDDEPLSFTKCADNTEEFLFTMLRSAACGWHGGERFTKQKEIERVLTSEGIDQRRLQMPDESGTCLDGEYLYFYCESGSSRELRIANRTLSKHQASGHLSDADQMIGRKDPGSKKSGERSSEPCAVPLTVEFGFGDNEWLAYNPRHAFSEYYAAKERERHYSKPQGGIPLQPWIAWMIQRNFNHIPTTAYDWDRDIARIKSLNIEPRFSTIISEDEEYIYFREPGSLPLPAPYYYDLHDWSVIGRMTKLQSLDIKGVYIDDFSFLRNCKNLKRLKLYKTNFTDCELLSNLPNLKEVHLIFCPLGNIDLLQKFPFRCCTEGTILLHPKLKVEAVPAFKKKEICDKDIEKLLESDYCCFMVWEHCLKISFSADRAAFIRYIDWEGITYYYDNGSGKCEPVDLIVDRCPEEWMMCYDQQVIRRIVYYFCGTGFCLYKNYVKVK